LDGSKATIYHYYDIQNLGPSGGEWLPCNLYPPLGED